MIATPSTPSPALRSSMQSALRDLNEALDSPRMPGALAPWRQAVIDRLTSVFEALTSEGTVAEDGWLADRSRSLQRERRALLGRLTGLSARLGQARESDLIRIELKRFLVDCNHHVQKVHDLAYDDVEFEVGGSE